MAEAVSSRFKEFTQYSARAPWKLNVKPFRLAPRIYFVGNEWVGAFLIDTEEGLILLDTGVFEMTYYTLENIRTLGFNPYDIKHIMLTHGHFDHTGAAQAFKELTGAKIWLDKLDADNPGVRDVGDKSLFHIIPHDVDCYYDHSEPMKFGQVTIKTILTPGHTPGTVSFLITMPDENGNPIVAAVHGGVGPLTMTDETLERIGAPMNLREVFIADCDKLKEYSVDIAIASHPAHGDLFSRCGEDPMDYSKFVNKSIWPEFLEQRKQFVIELDIKEKEKRG